MQLMWTYGISASALRITVLLSTRSPTSEGWTAELAVGCWLLAVGLWLMVPTTGIRTLASKPRMIRNTAP